jgi:hypothetical protein
VKPRLAMNTESSCLSLLSAKITSVCIYTWLVFTFINNITPGFLKNVSLVSLDSLKLKNCQSGMEVCCVVTYNPKILPENKSFALSVSLATTMV